MRVVQIAVPESRRDDVVDTLHERDLGFVETEGTGRSTDQRLLTFIVPADAVEHVLEDLVAAGYDRQGYLTSIDAEFASFEGVDEVQDRWEKTPNRLAPAALRSKAKDLRRNTRSYLWMMALSAVVATAGLFMGSPAVVVGSMVIAPIVSPALTASIGTVRNDRDMLVDSIHQQGLGLGVAIATSTVVSWGARQIGFVPDRLAIEYLSLLTGRLSPSLLAVGVALAAGAAGAYGLATKGSASIVGVMIAAALIPTASTAGIGIAWGNASVAAGASLLLVLSMLGINIAGAAMLWYLDYRPDDVDAGLFSTSGLERPLVVGLTAVVVLGALVVSGVAFAQYGEFERSVNGAVSDVLDEQAYDGLGVRSVSLEYHPPLQSGQPEVTVALARTVDAEFPDLPDAIDRQITRRTGQDVRVEVRYTDYDRSTWAGDSQSDGGAQGTAAWFLPSVAT